MMKQKSNIASSTLQKGSSVIGGALDFSFKGMRSIQEVLDLKQKKAQSPHNQQQQKAQIRGPQNSEKQIEEAGQTRLNIVRTIEVQQSKGNMVKQLVSKKTEKTSSKVTKKHEIHTTNLFLRYNKLPSTEKFIDIVKELLPNSAWQQLMWVDLSHNRLTNINRQLQMLPQLKTLYLHCNFIYQFKELQNLQQAKLLKTFTIHGNPIESLLTCILPQLQKIDSVLLTKRQKERGQILKKQGGKYPIIENPPKPLQQSQSQDQM